MGSGILRVVPAAVAEARSVDDVVALVRWAAAEGVALIPRGGGTAMPGSNVGPGVVLLFGPAFQHVTWVASDRLRVGVGATLGATQAEALRRGWRFPVDPSSAPWCTWGGALGTNAAGPRTVRFGSVRRWVAALDVVGGDGERRTLRRGASDPALPAGFSAWAGTLRADAAAVSASWPAVLKNSSGYALRDFLASGDALDLLVGAEGTLAVVLEAEVRLLPRPAAEGLLLVALADWNALAPAVGALRPLAPTTLELLDEVLLARVPAAERAAAGVPDDATALLLASAEGDDEATVQRALATWAEAVRPWAAATVSLLAPAARAAVWRWRREASLRLATEYAPRVSMQFVEDCVVPLERLGDFVRDLRRILEDHGLPAAFFGHAGDGNLHVNPLVDVRRPDWRSTVRSVLEAAVDLVARLGGTLSGEHGDGRLRAPFLERIWAPQLVAHFRALKQVWDPAGILNPGVKLALPGQDPLAALGPYEEGWRPPRPADDA